MAYTYDPAYHSDLIVKFETAKKTGFIQFRAMKRYFSKVEELKDLHPIVAKQEALKWVKRLLGDRYEIFPINLTKNWDETNLAATLGCIRLKITHDQQYGTYYPLMHVDSELIPALEFTIRLINSS